MNFSSYGVLLQSIKAKIRENAENVPRFKETKQGAIRLLACPFSQDGYEWLGASGEFIPLDEPDIEDSFRILPGGSRVAVFEEDGSVVEVDTYAVTAMKIAWLSRAQELIEPMEGEIDDLINSLRNLGLLSMSEEDIETMLNRMGQVASILQELEKLKGEDGFAMWRGANCCKVYLEGKPFAYFYASVSGAKQEEDQDCAMGAVEVVKTFFSDARFKVIAPTLKAEA